MSLKTYIVGVKYKDWEYFYDNYPNLIPKGIHLIEKLPVIVRLFDTTDVVNLYIGNLNFITESYVKISYLKRFKDEKYSYFKPTKKEIKQYFKYLKLYNKLRQI